MQSCVILILLHQTNLMHIDIKLLPIDASIFVVTWTIAPLRPIGAYFAQLKVPKAISCAENRVPNVNYSGIWKGSLRALDALQNMSPNIN